MRNKKGFTLVELLAMLVVLALLMAIAVPNITGILGNQRVNTYKADAINLVEAAKVKVAKETTIDKPQTGQCLFLTLDFLDDNDDFSAGPNGGEYMRYESFVVYTKEPTDPTNINGPARYKYYVRLVEKKDGKYMGINLRENTEVKNMKKKDIASMTQYGLTNDRAAGLTIINNNFKATNTEPPKCSSNKYYTHMKKCVIEDDTYYGSNGNIVDEATYLTQCS